MRSTIENHYPILKRTPILATIGSKREVECTRTSLVIFNGISERSANSRSGKQRKIQEPQLLRRERNFEGRVQNNFVESGSEAREEGKIWSKRKESELEKGLETTAFTLRNRIRSIRNSQKSPPHARETEWFGPPFDATWLGWQCYISCGLIKAK